MRLFTPHGVISNNGKWACVFCADHARHYLRRISSEQRWHPGGRYVGTRATCSLHGSRAFHSSVPSRDQFDEHSQAVPLGDFYTDLLAKPMPKESRADTSLPTFVRSGDPSKEERARQLFGTIRGSGYERKTYDKPDATWRTINGVPIPPRPAEPENCCMSGCVQ